MANTAQLQASLTLNSSAFAAGLERANAMATKTGQTIGNALKSAGSAPLKTLGGVISSFVSGPLLALSAGIAGALAGKAIYSGVAHVYELGNALNDLATQTGGTLGGLAQLNAAFGAEGMGVEELGSSINRMQKKIEGGSEAFDRLGLSTRNLSGLSPDKAFVEVGKALSQVPEAGQKAALAMDIFGRSGAQLFKVFESPAFKNAGGPLSGKAKILAENAETFDRASKALHRAGGMMSGLYVGIAGGIGGAILPVLDKINSFSLVETGQRFGRAVVAVGQFLVGAFKYPTALLSVAMDAMQAAGRSFANIVAAAAVYVGQRFAAIGSVLSSAFGTVFGAIGNLTSGLALRFQGQLMQAPASFIKMLGGGLDYITGELPGKLLIGLGKALAYLYAGFVYAADSLSSAVAKGLLSAALQFAVALTSPMKAIRGMITDALTGGAVSFADTLKDVTASGLFAPSASGKPKSYGEYANQFSQAIGADALANRGKGLEFAGEGKMAAAMGQLVTLGATLPSGLSNALAHAPRFQIKDVAGAVPYANRAMMGINALQQAGARAMGGGSSQSSVADWQIAEANRIQAFSLAQSRGNAIGGPGSLYMGPSLGRTAAFDADFKSSGLSGGAAYTRRWNATHGLHNGGKTQGASTTKVSSPDVVAELAAIKQMLQGAVE